MTVGLTLGAGANAKDAPMRVENLRCEYLVDPLGMDEAQPRLSWTLASARRGETQTAYRILVASSPEALARDEGDMWDSGRVTSNETAQIVYAGKPLVSRQMCWWKARVWDGDANASAWSRPARWSMGLLQPSDWRARWVSAPAPPREDVSDAPHDLAGLRWVWAAGENARQEAAKGTVGFRKAFTLPSDAKIREALFSLTADDSYILSINGRVAQRGEETQDAWRRPETVDVARFLQPGDNTLAIAVTNAGGPAGLVGVLKVMLESGDLVTVPVDGSWKASRDLAGDWTGTAFADAAWQQAAEIAAMGDAPWHIPGQSMHLDLPPSPFLRRAFRVDAPVARATLYITALGLYEARLNGKRVSDEVLRPGWTDYKTRVYYQTYDVTGLVRPGENALGAILADGWACGYVGLGGRDRYGVGRPRLMAQLEVETADGRTQTIATDAAWRAAYGPIREADLLMGETYDARREMPGWDTARFDDAGWQTVEEPGAWPAAVEAFPGVAVRPMRTLKAQSRTEPAPGAYVYDMGQNMVGWARVRVTGPAGTAVRLRFAEMLKPEDGTMYVTNLRSARNVDTYIKRTDAPETWEPRFTFHGFRYVEITGVEKPLPLDAVTGVVVHSDTPKTGSFETSNPLVNQLQSNIEWGQIGNFLEVPTDCPQRDERLGWTGDAQVFVRTACANMDVAAFFKKWMVDVEDAQRDNGAFTDVVPAVAAGAGTAAWADAGVIVPWTIYKVYGDRRILERHYDAMAKFITYLEAHSKDLLRPAEGYGEWLSINADTPKDVLGTAYFAYSTALMAKISDALGRYAEASKYRDLFGRIVAAFNKAYVSPDGRIHGDTQAVYVMALSFNLLPDVLRANAARYLVEDIEKRGNHLSTGFMGTAYLMPVLSAAGHTDTAYRLLLQDTFPGWLFSIKHGATTIWERWDGWTPEKGFQDPGMNSFNHYSFGAVDEWLYGTVAGIREDEARPGFRHFTIAPEPGGGLDWVRARYDSIRGPIESAWKCDGGRFALDVTVPPNTTATVVVPAASADRVTESGKPAANAEGVRFERMEGDRAVFTVASGQYRFLARP